MALIASVFKHQFFDDNGDPLSGGLLFTYEAGTTTPRVTYKDFAASQANTNPIVLNSRGECDVWLQTGRYKFVLKTAGGADIWTADSISSFADMINTQGALSVNNNLSDLSSSTQALVNLGIAPLSTQKNHTFTNNQAATDLTGRLYNNGDYHAVVFVVLIKRGTARSLQRLFLEWDGTAWALVDEGYSGDDHGLSFSISGTGVAQLRLASDNSGSGGSIHIKEHYYAP